MATNGGNTGIFPIVVKDTLSNQHIISSNFNNFNCYYLKKPL